MTGAGTPTARAKDALLYSLPALDGTVWLGLRPASLAALGAAVATAVAAMLAGVPLPLATVLLVAGTASAVVPLAGRTALSWCPLLAWHLVSRLRRRRGWTHDLHELGDDDRRRRPDTGPAAAADPSSRSTTGPGSGGSPATAGGAMPRVPLPPECGRLHLRALSPDTGDRPPVGVLVDRGSSELTVVFEVTGTDRFALLEPAGQDTRLAGWGTCLSALAADHRVLRVQWLTHTRPDTRRHYDDVDDRSDQDDQKGRDEGEAQSPTGAPDASGVPTGDLGADYRQLVARAARAALRHEHLLTLTLAPAGGGRVSSDGRPAGSRVAAPGQDHALVEVVRDLAAVLLTADLLPHPLSPAELGTAIRRLCDPTLTDPTQALADPRQWGVLSRQRRWDSCRTDDGVHRSYALTGWPRLALPADWLAPVLHAAPPDGTSRTFAVHAQPVAPAHAARRARAATAKARLDAADRSRLGFSPAAADTLAQTDAAALEAELVAGYRLTYLTALLTISAPDLPRLAVASQALQTLAVTHRLDLRPLHGQHPAGLVGCLPLGRALPGAAR